MTVVPVVNSTDWVGESPRWDPAGERLWWVDAEGATLHSYQPASGEASRAPLPSNASSLAVTADGGLTATMSDGLYRLVFDGPAPKTGSVQAERLVAMDPGHPACAFNDSGCDPRGRLWVGAGSETMTGCGRLFVLEPSARSARTVVDGLSLPNGIGWSPDGSTMYLADSLDLAVYRFEYGAACGTLGPREELFRGAPDDGLPDGLAVDTEGGVWVAFWDGGCVRRLTADGAVDAVIEVPVRRAAGVAFAGPGLAELYVTTARYELKPEELAEQPLAGGLFRVDVGVAGTPVSLLDSGLA